MDDRNDANIAVIPICDSLSFSSSFRSSTKLRILLRQCRICQKLSQASLVINTIRFFTIILIIGETRKSSYQRADSPFSPILLLVPCGSQQNMAKYLSFKRTLPLTYYVPMYLRMKLKYYSEVGVGAYLLLDRIETRITDR